MNRCRAIKCSRPIPTGQVFCKRCLDALPDETRHRIAFVDKSEHSITLAVAELERRQGIPLVAMATEAGDRFRSAREHAAAALRALDTKKPKLDNESRLEQIRAYKETKS